METVTITSRPARIWWLAAVIWILTAAVFAGLAGVQWLVLNDRPDTLDWILLAAIPTGLALGWLMYVWFTSGNRARQLTADDWGVTIERLNGRIVALAWKDIRAIEFNSIDGDVLALQTATARVVVLGDAFSREEWADWAYCVGDQIPDDVEFRDTQINFERVLTTWLDRASLGFALVGGFATVALAIWNPMNAAAWILFVGTLVVLIYLGTQAIDQEQTRIPIAKLIGFFSLKLLAIVPVALIVLGLVQPQGFQLPAHKHVALFYVSNMMFFGGMAGALLVRGGFSPEQHFRSTLGGLNRYHRHVFVAALAICIVGFILKVWNEK